MFCVCMAVVTHNHKHKCLQRRKLHSKYLLTQTARTVIHGSWCTGDQVHCPGLLLNLSVYH